MTTTIVIPERRQERRATAARWAQLNDVLRAGEWGFETDTGHVKIGDGITAWNSLGYIGVIHNGAAPADGDVLTYNAALGLWSPEPGGSGGSIDPSLQIDLYEDWFKGRTTSTNNGSNFVTDNALPVIYLGSTGSATTNVDAAGQRYLTLATVGSGGAARAALGSGPNIMVGGGEITLTASINLPVLSDATNRFQTAIGLRDAITGVAKYLEAVYQDDINSGKWRLRSLNVAPNSTDVDTCTVGPAAGAQQTVKLVINAAGTSVEMFIDNISQAILATNIPTTPLAFFVSHGKLAGATSRSCNLRYMRFQQAFTTPR